MLYCRYILRVRYAFTETRVLTRSMTKRKDTVLKIVFYSVSLLMTFFSFYPFFLFLKESYDYTFVEKQVFIGKLITKHYSKTSYYFDAFWKNYKYLFIGMGNSLLVSGVSTILTVYFSALTAYALTAYKWKLRRICYVIIMFAMMIPSTISTYGFLQLIFQMRLTNKLFVYILPAIASPMTVFFMCMYLQASLSYEMIQSARIDGASEFRIFNQIVLPLMKPAAATQAIFAFAASWNDGWMPSITIAKMEKKTLLLMFGPIYYLDSQDFLVVIASVIPLLILYACLSRHIVEGLSLGGLKE